MSGKTTSLSCDEFNLEGIFAPSGNECKFKDMSFRKGDTVEAYLIKNLLDTCNKYNAFGINTLIIKDAGKLTLWIEEKPKNVSKEAEQSPENMATSQSNQGLPTKTVTKRYRGQVYEETVVDWAAVQRLNVQNKPRRKYRGQYID